MHEQIENNSDSGQLLFIQKQFVSNSAEETIRFGEEFASALVPGTVVALMGELGSGKTTFIKGICRGLNVVDDITSPTFTLIHEYSGTVPVYHFDFYRIENSTEIFNLGCEDYFYHSGICLIEWADKVIDFLPEIRIEVHLKNCFNEGLENSRKITIREL